MGSQQQTLFGDPTPTPAVNAKVLARRTDPRTSHQAAEAIAPELNRQQKLFYDTLKAWASIPRTANEVAEKAIPIDSHPVKAIFSKRETLRKRAKELVDLDLISVCDARDCRVTGNAANTYEVI